MVATEATRPIERVCRRSTRQGSPADIAELNPSLDDDSRTARVAARLAARIARSPV